MRWSADTGHGFTSEGVEPWLPFGARPETSSRSGTIPIRCFPCAGTCWRRAASGRICARDVRVVPSPEGVWAWKRGDGHAVALNLGGEEATVDLSGTILIGTQRARGGEQFSSLTLRPSEGALLKI